MINKFLQFFVGMYLASTNFTNFSVSYETLANACTQICLLTLLNLAVLGCLAEITIICVSLK